MSDPIATVVQSAEPATGERFRAMMGGFPSGVAVVTAIEPDGSARGMTCSSLCSVALDPPTLLVCLRAASPTLAAVLLRGVFAVNLLHEDARSTAELFASGDPERFHRVAWRAEGDAAGPHLLDDAHTVADCTIRMPLPVGDHTVVFGEVYRVTRRSERAPLLYGRRRYGAWPPA
ncbi:flavin reductase [Actinomadura logoneensis]|uniref:Flavin reductase n=1 Tax=Actinomadura logoneensis TaxID=2293572 RepID=A0A372JFK9_9ACTN|nr:flavin reductase family protein [Actinomadura logoneensis]RFU38634.1 flavin reductase [Actinomadura logoneensis]